MGARQGDFLFAEHVLRRGYATEEQIQECLDILDRLKGEMNLDDSLDAILVKKGYLAKAQAYAVKKETQPEKAGEAGNQIEGYRLLSRIGAGAMGSVYKAEHLKLDIPVALKVLRLDHAASPTQIERLQREARLAASLDHPNIVRSLDVGESNGFHYFCMEYVEGMSVRELMRRRPLKEAEAVRITRDVAKALQHAHSRGVIHRDVKPGNIMITPAGEVKLTDLGLARGQEPSDLTLDTAAIGTPHYLAPEQARRGADATFRSDFFSLGASLYHMVTGRPAFKGETLGEIFQNVLSCRFEPPESVKPDLSIDTTYVIHRLMRPHPRERYDSAAELIHDLDAILKGDRVAPPDFRGDYRLFLERRRRKRRTLVVVGGACFAILVTTVSLTVAAVVRANDRERICASADKAVGLFGATESTRASDLRRIEALARALIEQPGRDTEMPAAECTAEELANLAAWIRSIATNAATLERAEELVARAGDDSASFRKLDAALERVPRAQLFKGASDEVVAHRKTVRESSDNAALTHRRGTYSPRGYDDATLALKALRTLASDLEHRYLPRKEMQRAVSADAETLEALMDAYEKADRSKAASAYLQARGGAKPDFRRAALQLSLVAGMKAEAYDEAESKELAGPFLALFERDDARVSRLENEERSAWQRIEEAAAKKRADGARDALQEFLTRAKHTRDEVERALKRAENELRELGSTQDREARELQQHVEGIWAIRSYSAATPIIEKRLKEESWLKAPRARIDALLARSRALESLPGRFLDRIRGGGTVAPIALKLDSGKSIDLRGVTVEAEPGGADLVVRSKAGVQEFTLEQVESVVLDGNRPQSFEEFLDLGAYSRVRGYLLAAESFRSRLDPRRARKLVNDAFKVLSALADPWAAELQRLSLVLTEEIDLRETNARTTYAAMLEAKERRDYDSAFEYCARLMNPKGLRYTDFVDDGKDGRLERILKEYGDLRRLTKGTRSQAEFGVPKGNLRILDPDQGIAELVFGFARWYPNQPPPGTKDPHAWLEAKARAYWEERCYDPAIKASPDALNRFVERGMNQAYRWSANAVVENGELRLRRENFKFWQDRKDREILPATVPSPFRTDRDWSIELTVRWDPDEKGAPRSPVYFSIGLGGVQAGVISFSEQRRGGGHGAMLFLDDDLVQGLENRFKEFHEGLLEDPRNRKKIERDPARSLFSFSPGSGYRVRLQRKGSKVFFHAQPLRNWEPGTALGKPVAVLTASRAGLNKAAGSKPFRILSFVPCRIDDVAITGTLPRDE